MSSIHRRIQERVAAQLPEAELEVRFDSIGRIADVVCFLHKVIYEVQCSPLSLSEAQDRTLDYSSLGFTLIWILHDQRFNQNIFAPAELYLRKHLLYYSSMTAFGSGFFYDQIAFSQGSQLLYKSKPFTVEALLPFTRKHLPYRFPKLLKERPPYCLPGDAVEHLLQTGEGARFYALEKSLCKRSSKRRWITPFFDYLLRRCAASSEAPQSKKGSLEQ